MRGYRLPLGAVTGCSARLANSGLYAAGMATWIVLIGVVLAVAIVGGALLVILVFTRETMPKIRLPRSVRMDHPGPDGGATAGARPRD